MAAWGQQEAWGDSSAAMKEKLWRSGCKICPKCGKQDIRSEDVAAGCRMNGDAYGDTRFTCNACNFRTSLHYDEASDVYYYETRDWGRKEKMVSHDYSGLPPVTIDPDGSERRKLWEQDQPGEWKKVNGKWVRA